MVTFAAIAASVMGAVAMWLFVAGLTEALTELVKNLLPNLVKDKVTYVASIVIGVALAFVFGLNPFGLAGIGAYASTVIAGVLASRGANYLNGLLKKLGILQSNK
ncbi:hypothetical protein IAQ67_29040 (plasmid) [Paenibacillus peoriae]|uniref:Holin n=1 Tax=Paenibacillus peoriae TaxID=59893 RepID=A0A7H0YH43_9BACL|nr:hypothetical protein [Paenibacillus peoriae]QNR70401.1 hypothetical protein IAQ67_29040 [Paenibacillus peoriae]